MPHRGLLWLLILLVTGCAQGGEQDSALPPPIEVEGIEDSAEPQADAGQSDVEEGESSEGRNAFFDSLHAACSQGDLAACDDLYRYAPRESAYSSFASTCGNRRESSGDAFCFDYEANEPTEDQEIFAQRLNTLTDECEKGMMPSCDELYWMADPASDEEAFGATCGNRQSAPVEPGEPHPEDLLGTWREGGAPGGRCEGLGEAPPDASPNGTDTSTQIDNANLRSSWAGTTLDGRRTFCSSYKSMDSTVAYGRLIDTWPYSPPSLESFAHFFNDACA